MKTSKRFLAGLCAFAMMLGTAAVLPEGAAKLGISIGTSAESYGDFEYTVLDDGTVEISRYNGEDTEVTIPAEIDGKKVTSIGDGAFFRCYGLTSITIPDSVTSIGKYAFGLCTSLSSVTIGNGVTSIVAYAFFGCTSLTSITIPDSVTSIGGYAFFCCESLTSIIIPDSVTSIGYRAFDGCSEMTAINVDNNNTVYSSVDGVLYDNDRTELLRCPLKKEKVTIPDGVTSIGDGAFFRCYGLTSITIPDSVTSIGNRAFQSCDSLTSITIPDSVTSIGDWTFENCNSLTSITIPDSVTSIGGSAFYCCESLTSITIPDSVTSIGEMAFGYIWDDETVEEIKIDGFKIYCYENTAGHQYAIDNGFDYELITDTLPGDADGDGETNMQDYALLQRNLAGWDVEIDEEACDLNRDGAVNMLDYGLMQRMLAGWDIGQ